MSTQGEFGERSMSENNPDQLLVEKFLPEYGVCSIVHEEDRGVHKSVPAWDYLTTLANTPVGTDIDFLHTVATTFSPESRFIYPVQDIQPDAVSVAELAVGMLQRTQPLYDLVQASLREINPIGYNDHGIRHIQTVMAQTLLLLRQAGYDEQMQKKGILAAAGHDLGNLFGRDYHSVLSVEMQKRIFPNASDPDVCQAIRLHDGYCYKQELEKMQGFTFAEKRKAMVRTWGPAGLALLIADKTDIGPARLDPISRTREAMHTNYYMEPNFLLESGEKELDSTGTQLQWKIIFDPVLSREQAIDFSQLAVPNANSETGYSRYSSPRTRRTDSSAGLPIPDYKKSSQLLLATDRTRIALAVLGTFALLPDLEFYTLRFEDKSPTADQSKEIRYVFTPDTFSSVVASMKQAVADVQLSVLPREIIE